MATTAITANGETVWECDRCDAMTKTANAFELPKGWWRALIERRTDEAGHRKAGEVITCSKTCFLEAVTYQNQELVPYVDPELN